MKTKFSDLKIIKAAVFDMVRWMDPKHGSVAGIATSLLKCKGDKTMSVDFQEKRGLLREKICVSLLEADKEYKVIVLHTRWNATIVVKDDEGTTMNVLFSKDFPSIGMGTMTEYEIAYEMYSEFVRYCETTTVSHNDRHLSDKIANYPYWVHRNFPKSKLLAKVANVLKERYLCDDEIQNDIVINKIKQILQKIFA